MITYCNGWANLWEYKKQIKNNNAWDIETYSVEGEDTYDITYSTGDSEVYVMKQDKESIMEAKKLFDKILETNKYTEEKKWLLLFLLIK